MERIETAYFVFRPRRIADLRVPHFPEKEHQYQIVADVTLQAIDYENFAEDLLADREFLEPYAEHCDKRTIYRCIFVHQKGSKEGILIVPERGCFVSCAAYLPER